VGLGRLESSQEATIFFFDLWPITEPKRIKYKELIEGRQRVIEEEEKM